jgi:predicted DNA-binding transcriptional regulator AlpA
MSNKTNTEQPPEDRLLPIKEASFRTGLSGRTITRREDEGLFPEHVKQGIRRYYYESDVRKYIEGLRMQRS